MLAAPPKPVAPPRSGRPVAAPALADEGVFAGNPVAAAHRAGRPDHDAAAGSLLGRALLFGVALPTLLFLAATPLGWVLLVLGALSALILAPALAM